jgi:hypothetical protein
MTYYEDHKETLTKQMKIYYEQNKKKIINYQKEYNKKIPVYQRRNKDNIYYNTVRKYNKLHKKEPFQITVNNSADNLIVEF